MTDMTGKYLKHHLRAGKTVTTQYLYLDHVDQDGPNYGDGWVFYIGTRIQFGQNQNPKELGISLNTRIMIKPDADSENCEEISKDDFDAAFASVAHKIQRASHHHTTEIHS